ncbi:transcriptional regulator [Bacillus cereus]|nr:transcriptional regulator [Bacillus cereus]
MFHFGLGKRRTPFGNYLDCRGIKQQWLVERTGLSKSLISDLANKKERIPTLTSATKIIKTLKKFDNSINYHDFWDIDI